jgi:hypothetical protein
MYVAIKKFKESDDNEYVSRRHLTLSLTHPKQDTNIDMLIGEEDCT